MRYRKKPVEIEARRLITGAAGRAVAKWCGGQLNDDGSISILTLEGAMRADLGDWIIQGVQGEFYPCKPSIFDATYEPVPS